MLQPLIRKQIQTRQAANAGVGGVERHGASHMARDDLFDPLWAKLVTGNENAR